VLSRATRRWRLSVCIALFSLGLLTATWVTRTPAIRDAVHASTAEMGLLLFGISTGAMIGVLASSSIVKWFGARWVACGGVSLSSIGTVSLAAGSLEGSETTVFTGFLLFGLGMGLSDVALNISASAIETATDTHVLPLLHGSFGLGTVIGQ
jgi:fucose permease